MSTYWSGNEQMEQGVSNSTIPVTRVLSLLPYTSLLRSIGAPVERLLTRAKISPDLLNHPTAAVPLERAFRFGELACKTQGTEHIGLHIGLANSLDDLGSYGQMLQGALTMHDYLRKGISMFNMLTTGQRFWLSEHGDELRFNFESVGDAGIGKYQTEIESLAGLVQLQVESMLPRQPLHIDAVAESLAMSTRGLQRKLAKQGVMYSQVLAETRIHQAAGWLENDDKPIVEIAFDLGYQDASNFTRAFRRHTGVPPQVFRENARRN